MCILNFYIILEIIVEKGQSSVQMTQIQLNVHMINININPLLDIIYKMYHTNPKI